MPVCCAQATPPIRFSPASNSSSRRGTSMRDDIFTGPSSPQPRCVQYAEMSSNLRHLPVDHPLAGRHVAVQAGDERADREAVVDGQRLAVHGDRQHRVAVVGQRGERGAAGPAVVGGLQHGVGAVLDAGLAQQVGGRTPLHQALPISRPPTGLETQLRVTHASVGSRGHQVGVGEHHLAVDHPVDPQLPVLRLDRRRDQRGVDQVERVVRGPPRGDALEADRDVRRGRRAR